MSKQSSKIRGFFEILKPLQEWTLKTKKEDKALDSNEWLSIEEKSFLLSYVWEHPECIDEYLDEKGDALSPNTRETLSQWKKHYVNDIFFVERIVKGGIIYISSTTGQVYVVNETSSEIDQLLDNTPLPYAVHATLLPYADKILSDNRIGKVTENLSPEFAKELTNIYDAAKKRNRLIKKIPVRNDIAMDEEWNLFAKTAMSALMAKKPFLTMEMVEETIANEPRLNLLTKKELATLKKLNDQPSRSEKDWDRIKEILFARCVFTAEPIIPSNTVKGVEHVLCDEGTLLIFTTFEKCQDYLQSIKDKIINQRYFNFSTIDFLETIRIADRHHMNLYIDFTVNASMYRFLQYSSLTKRLTSMIAVR